MEELSANIKEKCHDTNLRLVCCEERWPPSRSNRRLVELNLVIKGRGESYKSVSLTGKRNPVSYCDILRVKGPRKNRKVLIEGGAGMGKTSLCIPISEKWAYGTLFQEYQLVLFLPLYKENIISSSNFPSEWLHEFDPAVGSYMHKKKGKGVLIIADGWDRLDETLRLEGSYLHTFLFRNCSLGHITVILTSRPTFSAPLHKGNFIDCFIEIDGFSEKSISEYIRSEFPTNSILYQALIGNNQLILNICNVPLNSAIVCHLWCELEDLFPSTVTELCNEIILNVIFRNVQEGKEYTSSYNPCNIEDAMADDLRDSWKRLCQLAFQHITNDDRLAIKLPSECIQCGMIKFGLVEFVPEEESMTCHFLHQVFQEYLASLYVVEQSLNLQIKMLKSLSRSECKHRNVFWQSLFGMQRDQTDILVHVFQMLGHQRSLLICLCAFEAGSDFVTNKAIKFLHSSTCSIRFGHPSSIHECNAILYTIENMKCLECHGNAMELSFSDCGIGEKQLCKLADVLVMVYEKHNLRALDLSENKLCDESVADLFNKASTAFQSLEKLFLCKNKIGEAGTSAIMGALAKSTCHRITQLDLSFNPLGPTGGLNALLKALSDDVLPNLEVVLLRGSFMLNADANVQYLSRLANTLLFHCQQLQRLDLSRNDFGKPIPSVVNSIIDEFLTSFGEKFLIVFDKKYMSKVEEKFMAIMNDVIEQKRNINYTTVHGVIVGPGRSGKDSLMHRLMGEFPPDSNAISCSTGVLEKVIKVEVQKLSTVAASVDSLVWNGLDYDDEAIELMMTTVKYQKPATTSKDESTPGPNFSENIIPSAVLEVEKKCTSSVNPIRLIRVKGTTSNCRDIEARKTCDVALHLVPSESDRLAVFKRALELRHMDGLREHLESSWSLYLTNTGGQVEFQELLPLLVCGPTVFFVTFPLNKSLQEHYTVRYHYTDGSEVSYQSPATLMDEILQTLATIASLDCTGPQHDYVHLKPKVFFVGTHKDQLPQSSADVVIQEIDEQLKEAIQQTSLARQGSIEYAISTQQKLVFTVNNLDRDDSDFQKIRVALQKAVLRSEEFTVCCPSRWLVFSLVLRAKYKSSQVLSYNDCYTIAHNCGIFDETEFKEALLFIHARLGLIRYFSVKELNTYVVIDPRILFDVITELIVGTFISDHAKINEIKSFQRGIFSIERMKEIVNTKLHQSDTHLSFEWVLKLLEHLRIAAMFRDSSGDKKCFFPSVICHTPKQQPKSSTLSSKLPPPLLVAFESGFCPRGIPGALISYLMTNEMKSQIFWEFYEQKIFQNHVSFNVGSCDIILKILPTHLEFSFDPESGSDDIEKIKATCEEVFTQIEVAMNEVTVGYCERGYYVAFYCTKCTTCPAKIEWSKKMLHCAAHSGRVGMPKHYGLWIPQKDKLTYCQSLDQVIDHGSDGVPKHLGQIADIMCEWEGRIAGELGLIQAEVEEIKYKHKDNLNLQKRAALQKWKEKQGSEATYKKLIQVFNHAGNEQCADTVRNLVSVYSDQEDKFFDCLDYQTSLSSPPPFQLPEFPESVTLTAATVQLEDKQETIDRDAIHIKANEIIATPHNDVVEHYGAISRETAVTLKFAENPRATIGTDVISHDQSPILSKARSDIYSHELISNDDTDEDDETSQRPFRDFSSTTPRFSHLMDQHQLNFDEHEQQQHHQQQQQRQQKTSGPSIILEPIHETQDSRIPKLEEVSNSETIKILEESNKEEKGLLGSADTEYGQSLPERVKSSSKSANKLEGGNAKDDVADTITTVNELQGMGSRVHKEAEIRISIQVPETPFSSHPVSCRSMRSSVSERDSQGDSPLVSSPLQLTASELGGMDVSPFLTSAAASTQAKRKVARAEDLSKLTIKPSDLDIMISPPTPGGIHDSSSSSTGAIDISPLNSPRSSMVSSPVIIQRSKKGYGFTLKSIRVYIGETNNYRLHHIVETVDKKGPAWEAGLRPSYLITHINGESITGLQHVQVLHLMINKRSNVINVSTIPLEETSIRKDTRKRIPTVGHRVRKLHHHGSSENGQIKKRPSFFERLQRDKRSMDQTDSPGHSSSGTSSPKLPSSLHISDSFKDKMMHKITGMKLDHRRQKQTPVSPLARNTSSVALSHVITPNSSPHGSMQNIRSTGTPPNSPPNLSRRPERHSMITESQLVMHKKSLAAHELTPPIITTTHKKGENSPHTSPLLKRAMSPSGASGSNGKPKRSTTFPRHGKHKPKIVPVSTPALSEEVEESTTNF